MGDKVIRLKSTKKTKLDLNYGRQVYTALKQLHKNTFIWARSNGVKLKRAINVNNLKLFVQRLDEEPKVLKI